MSLEEFVTRGVRAQAAVDTSVDAIVKSDDVAWLNRVMTNRDGNPAIRIAARRRLKKLQNRRTRR